jgi:hypothetical protein
VTPGGLTFALNGVPAGMWPQVYRGSLRGHTRREKVASLRLFLAQCAAMGLPGVVFHGFPRELIGAHSELIALASEVGLLSAFSWGLDSSKDNDGSRLTAAEKGECVGAVMAHSMAAFGLLDAESQWDKDTGPDDDMDEAGALELGAALRRSAPLAVMGDQPWFAIQWHGDERVKPEALARGGTFRGFPSDEFASFVQFRAPQVYWNDFHGADRGERIVAWHEKDWTEHDKSLARNALQRPRTYTLQAYGHDDIPWALVHTLIALEDRPAILWSEPFPTRPTLRCMAAVLKLRALGFTGPGAVRRFQASANATGAMHLAEDDAAGPATLDALLGPPA